MQTLTEKLTLMHKKVITALTSWRQPFCIALWQPRWWRRLFLLCSLCGGLNHGYWCIWGHYASFECFVTFVSLTPMRATIWFPTSYYWQLHVVDAGTSSNFYQYGIVTGGTPTTSLQPHENYFGELAKHSDTPQTRVASKQWWESLSVGVIYVTYAFATLTCHVYDTSYLGQATQHCGYFITISYWA